MKNVVKRVFTCKDRRRYSRKRAKFCREFAESWQLPYPRSRPSATRRGRAPGPAWAAEAYNFCEHGHELFRGGDSGGRRGGFSAYLPIRYEEPAASDISARSRPRLKMLGKIMKNQCLQITMASGKFRKSLQ